MPSQLDYEPRGKGSSRTVPWEWLLIAFAGALLLATLAYLATDILTIRVAG